MEELVMRREILMAAAVVATACSAGSESTIGDGSSRLVTSDSTLMAQWKVELIEADRGFEQSVQKTGLGGWLSAFAPDGMMVSGGSSYIGQEGIRRAVLPMFADPAFELRWDPTLASIGPSGDLGYTIGTYNMTISGETGPATQTGSYLTVWRRQPNG
ncbi:MAG: nuclear transport factor 2 family protein, partial [Gemmatimonadales bacterium]